jgi:hypothetical protein
VHAHVCNSKLQGLCNILLWHRVRIATLQVVDVESPGGSAAVRQVGRRGLQHASDQRGSGTTLAHVHPEHINFQAHTGSLSMLYLPSQLSPPNNKASCKSQANCGTTTCGAPAQGSSRPGSELTCMHACLLLRQTQPRRARALAARQTREEQHRRHHSLQLPGSCSA